MAARQFKNTYMSHDTFLLGCTALELQLLQDSTFFWTQTSVSDTPAMFFPYLELMWLTLGNKQWIKSIIHSTTPQLFEAAPDSSHNFSFLSQAPHVLQPLFI